MDHEKMGRLIAERRKVRGMTQLDLANKLHITDKAVSKWERGLSCPDIGLLPQLADELGISVSDLLKGEITDTADDTGNITEVLTYAEKAVQKKYDKIRLLLSLGVVALLLTGIPVCAIVDVAVTNSISWSLYPISSALFVWCLLFPILYRGKRGILLSMLMLTVLIFPFLLVIDRISDAEGFVLRIGGVAAVIALVFLWIAILIMKGFKKRRLVGGGIVTILAAPFCVLINASLSFTLTPEAGVFDAWDALGIIILTAIGVSMICFDLIYKKMRR